MSCRFLPACTLSVWRLKEKNCAVLPLLEERARRHQCSIGRRRRLNRTGFVYHYASRLGNHPIVARFIFFGVPDDCCNM